MKSDYSEYLSLLPDIMSLPVDLSLTLLNSLLLGLLNEHQRTGNRSALQTAHIVSKSYHERKTNYVDGSQLT